jgi:hypothetical protein
MKHGRRNCLEFSEGKIDTETENRDQVMDQGVDVGCSGGCGQGKAGEMAENTISAFANTIKQIVKGNTERRNKIYQTFGCKKLLSPEYFPTQRFLTHR